MFRTFFWTFVWLIIVGWGKYAYGQNTVMSFPDFPLAKGVSAPFAGFVGNRLIVAGGCNFPDVPAAEGGRKKFYNAVYAIDVNVENCRWKYLSSLPFPVAYGVSVVTEKGLVCIGGQNEQGTLDRVFLLKADGQILSLPSLPVPIDNGGAAVYGTTVYVTGGNQPNGGKALYSLDLSSPVTWKRLTDYPGYRRVQPVVLAASGEVYLIGGYDFSMETQKCVLSVDMLRYDIASGEWSTCDVLVSEKGGAQRCMVGGSGVVSDGNLILAGGVNYSVFKQAMEGKAPEDYMMRAVDWYRFNDDILLYDLIGKNWRVMYDVQGMARAGGILLEHDHLLYMVCGELKPGIRSPQITLFSLSNLAGK